MSESALLLPAQIESKACYVNAHGSVVLTTPFLRGGWFFENRAPVFDGRKYGFIDSSGSLIVPAALDKVGRFSEGHCAANIGGKWGLIDLVGRWVVGPQYADVGRCSHGLVGVSKKQGYDLSYIDLQGNIVIESVGSKGMSAFSDGMISAEDESTGLYGFLDVNGDWAISPKFTSSGEYSDGLAAVDVLVGKTELTGYIDTSGREILPFKFITTLSPYQCGLIVVCEKKMHHLFGAINKYGDWVVEPTFAYLDDFFGGMSMFKHSENGKFGFLDTNGDIIIDESYFNVQVNFKYGIAKVQDEHGWLYINKKGECIWRHETT